MFWLNTISAAACGALLSAALPALHVYPLALALVPVFVFVANSETSKQAFWYGFSFGFALFALHLLWLPVSFADIFGAVFWIFYPLMLMILGSFWGLVTMASRLLGGRGNGALSLLPVLWVLMEWARTQGYFAFPWGKLGYIWLGTPVAQVADVIGVYGLSLLTTVIAALLASLFIEPARSRGFAGRGLGRSSARMPRWQALLAVLLLASASVGYGLWRLGQDLPVADQQALLVQGNTNPLEGTIGGDRSIELYARLTRRALEDSAIAPTLVVWPEGAVSGSNLEGFNGLAERSAIQDSAGAATVIAGGSADGAQGERFNSVYSLVSAQIMGRYDKHYLVPFGERWPFLYALEPVYRMVFSWLNLPMLRGTSPGEAIVPINTRNSRAGVYICYESVFPQVARTMVREGAEFLVNISNDAWFGRGRGAEQHFLMGSMRAIETRRFLLRVGNDGITALVDPLGRIPEGQILPRRVQQTLVVNYGLSNVETFYVRFGHWLVWLLLLYTLLAVAWRTFTR